MGNFVQESRYSFKPCFLTTVNREQLTVNRHKSTLKDFQASNSRCARSTGVGERSTPDRHLATRLATRVVFRPGGLSIYWQGIAHFNSEIREQKFKLVIAIAFS
ncbi:MAG: hypothetical protein U7126_16930 [Microcoleus sp.]